jgi:protein-tyrosine phosphatase/ADP-ribose pyrophosphatase YjhB (NUDIX family)
MAKPVAQAGVIAWRHGPDGREVVLVTSTRTGRWGVPKGMVEADLGVVRSAVEEGWEEAGVRGVVGEPAVGAYTYVKWGRPHRVELFALRVTETADVWPEQRDRERVWVPLAAAAAQVESPELATVLARFAAGEVDPIRVSWVPPEILAGRLGVCSLPGERTGARDADLEALRLQGVTHLLCLVEASELGALEPPETPTERARAVERAGMVYLHVPVVDFEAPSAAQLDEAVAFVEAALAGGGCVVVHCWAGLGRSGAVLGGVFVRRGMRGDDAIVTTRWVRPGRDPVGGAGGRGAGLRAPSAPVAPQAVAVRAADHRHQGLVCRHHHREVDRPLRYAHTRRPGAPRVAPAEVVRGAAPGLRDLRAPGDRQLDVVVRHAALCGSAVRMGTGP